MSLIFDQLSSSPLVNCNKILVLSILLIGMVSGTSPLQAQTSSDTTTTSGETVAIRVENETVPMSVFQNRVEAILTQAKRKAKKKKKKNFDVEKAREKIENHLKKRLLSRLILDVHAEKSGATVPQKQIDRQIQKRIQLAGGKKAFEKRIQKRGMTLEQFKDQLRKKLLRKNFVEQEIGPITVSDTEVMKVYRDNKEQLSRYNKARAVKVLRRKIRDAKRNRKSKALVARLRNQSDIEINI